MLRGEYEGGKDLSTNLGSGPAQTIATAVACYAQHKCFATAGPRLGAREDADDPMSTNGGESKVMGKGRPSDYSSFNQSGTTAVDLVVGAAAGPPVRRTRDGPKQPRAGESGSSFEPVRFCESRWY